MVRKKSFQKALNSVQGGLKQHVVETDYYFFPDPRAVADGERRLADNLLKFGEPYCPVRPPSGNPDEDRHKVCPCNDHFGDIARTGYCPAKLFASLDFIRRYLQQVMALSLVPAPSTTAEPSGAVEDLSERETQVIRLVAAGLTNRQIADRLVISAATAKTHVENIIRKLGVSDRTQAAVQEAVMQGLVD